VLEPILSKEGRKKVKKEKPVVYIASPYSKGDPCVNTYFQCKLFDELLTEGLVLPVAPLWSHFQHSMFPRPYEDWIYYDNSLLRLYDACLRLNAEVSRMGYVEEKSKGADLEAEYFVSINKPVFYKKSKLYQWVKQEWEKV
jgi:hypothetical protein